MMFAYQSGTRAAAATISNLELELEIVAAHADFPTLSSPKGRFLFRPFESGHFFQHIFIRRTDFVIHLDKAVAHLALTINHVGGRMWQRTAGLFIEQAVTINHAMIGVGKHREIAAGLVFQFFAQEAGLVVRVNADGEDGNFVTIVFIEQCFQLTKLSRAIRSPVATIKDQYDCLFAAIGGERDGFTVLIF
jgi:hypothetical protein